jgi:hypothetical protein
MMAQWCKLSPLMASLRYHLRRGTSWSSASGVMSLLSW